MASNIFTPSLFPDVNWGTKTDIAQNKSRKQWQFKKSKNMGLEYCTDAIRSGKYGITKLKKYLGDLPNKFITLHDINKVGSPNIGVLGFSYDYVLEELAYHVEKYVPLLLNYKCFGEPDFSIKIGDPLACAISSTFRSHNIAYYLQQMGCPIIPTMKWSDGNSYDVCFDGYERGGAVLVSTMGVLKDERSHMYFADGFREMLKRISPDAVVLYGESKEWIRELFPSQLHVQHIENERIKRMRNYGRKRSF
ncbi:MAG: DUF4417 domain-containing protein [Prevotellamassilia sp.]|nr:DUF4417 domain-containing protein [Prevotellamassilia sp.]